MLRRRSARRKSRRPRSGLDGVHHRKPRKRLGKVDFDAAAGHDLGAEDVSRDRADEVLGQIHNPVVIGIRLIQFQQREFGVVARVHTLVAEHAAQLVHLLKAADDQPLEMQLQRDAEVEVDVERIMMRDEGARIGAAGHVVQDRRFHLQKSALVEIAADFRR